MQALKLRPPTDVGWKVINKLAASLTAPAYQVRRAQLLRYLATGVSAPKAANLVGGLTAQSGRNVLKRFNQEGLKVLEYRPRSGRPPILSEQDRGRLVMLAQSPPQESEKAAKGACHWTLDSLLEAARKEGIAIGRTRLWEVLNQEGMGWWRRSRSWLVSDDPQLPEKRGTSSLSTPIRRRIAR